MPSDKEYLDSLLKEMSEENENSDPMAERGDQAPDMEALSEMTEHEIARMLSGKAVRSGNPVRPEDPAEMEDVFDLLEGAQGDDLQEIQELLQKSDRNEMIYGDVPDIEEEDPVNKLLEDIEAAGDEKAPETPIDKKAQRALLKEQKKKEKEEKRAAKKAAKAAAKEKASRKGKRASDLGQEAEPLESNSDGLQGADRFDADMLDSIVSGADRLKRDGSAGREKSTAEASRKIPEVPTEDIVAVDIDQIDELIPDVSERRGESKEKKKPGFMAKAISFLMEEEEEEEEKAPENEDILLSDENQEILKALEGEGSKAADASKGKKSKKKAKKKDTKAKKAQKAKKPKPKKVKKPKEAPDYIPGPRLSFKKMLPILLLALSVGAVTLILVTLSVDYGDKREAERAFAEKKYETCYLNLFGKDRTEEQERMYVASESILYMRLMMKEYESYVEEGSEVKALDSLIQTVSGYPALNAYASQWEAVTEVYDLHDQMVNILDWKYGLSETQALEIAAVKSDLEYTRIVTALAKGGSYGSWGRPAVVEPDNSQEIPEELPDELPEEEELDPGEFVDNQ